MAPLALVHLVRQVNGLEPFRRFLDSYRAHDPGAEHELLIAYKGFDDPAATAAYATLLQDVPHRSHHVPDPGFDIGAYFRMVRRFDHGHFAFVNSFSRILCDGWLGKLHAAVRAPGVGVAAASGSWQSLNNAAGRRAKQRSWLRRKFFELKQPFLREDYDEFPNAHVRTNAFCAARELLLRLEVPAIRDKRDAHRFESGRRGFTAQVLAAGQRIVVVGCDGRAYAPADWPASRTFRAGGQANLLVADNQTDGYARADAAEQARLAALTWGASPGVVELARS